MAVSKIPRTCRTCGVVYYGWTGNAGFYCSLKCYHAGDRPRAIERFWARVKKTDGCWLWLGRCDKDGYGQSGIGKAHKVSFELTNGSTPDGMSVLHRCDNPPCVNPAHLYAGTPADNMNDRLNAGHYGRGESHPMAVLDEAAVLKIRSLYVPRQNGVTVLGKQFGVAPTTIHAIVTRKIWKHI